MASWFTDNAFFPVLTGGILAVVFFFFFVMSREKLMLYIAVIVAVLAGGIFVCEQVIVTEREQIQEIVNDLAYQVRTNNLEGVVSRISPKRDDTIRRARAEMPKYFFDDCRLTGITSFEDLDSKPGVKRITFTVVFRVSLLPDKSRIPGQRGVLLDFEKDQNGEWKVIHYEHYDPRENIRL